MIDEWELKDTPTPFICIYKNDNELIWMIIKLYLEVYLVK